MKILLITSLYPGYLNQPKNEVTYSIHYFVKNWINENQVIVIRVWPYYYSFFNFLNKIKKNNKFSKIENMLIDGVNVYRIPIRKFPKLRFTKSCILSAANSILNILGKIWKPDVIVCERLYPFFDIALYIKQKIDCNIVVSLHNSDILYLSNLNNKLTFIQKATEINKIVFRSHRIMKGFLSQFYMSNIQVMSKLIPFGIEYKYIIDKNKLEYKIYKTNKTFIVVASLLKLKKIDVIIKAFAKITNNLNYVLKIVGSGPEFSSLTDLVIKFNLQNNIHFYGYNEREAVLDLMDNSDVFVLVSSPETFGLVYLEAMARGCITIGSKGEGIDGIIVNDYNGYLCYPDDVNDLSVLFQNIINIDISKKREILENAIETAKSLNYEKLSEDYLDFIKI